MCVIIFTSLKIPFLFSSYLTPLSFFLVTFSPDKFKEQKKKKKKEEIPETLINKNNFTIYFIILSNNFSTF